MGDGCADVENIQALCQLPLRTEKMEKERKNRKRTIPSHDPNRSLPNPDSSPKSNITDKSRTRHRQGPPRSQNFVRCEMGEKSAGEERVGEEEGGGVKGEGKQFEGEGGAGGGGGNDGRIG